MCVGGREGLEYQDLSSKVVVSPEFLYKGFFIGSNLVGRKDKKFRLHNALYIRKH